MRFMLRRPVPGARAMDLFGSAAPFGPSAAHDRHGHCESDRRRRLERESDADTVHEAVPDQRHRRQHADIWMPVRGVVVLVHAVNEDKFLQAVEEQKPATSATMAGSLSLPRRQFKDFRQQVERDDCRQDASGESQDQVQPVAKRERAKSTQRCWDDGDQGKVNGGYRTPQEDDAAKGRLSSPRFNSAVESIRCWLRCPTDSFRTSQSTCCAPAVGRFRPTTGQIAFPDTGHSRSGFESLAVRPAPASTALLDGAPARAV